MDEINQKLRRVDCQVQGTRLLVKNHQGEKHTGKEELCAGCNGKKTHADCNVERHLMQQTNM